MPAVHSKDANHKGGTQVNFDQLLFDRCGVCTQTYGEIDEASRGGYIKPCACVSACIACSHGPVFAHVSAFVCPCVRASRHVRLWLPVVQLLLRVAPSRCLVHPLTCVLLFWWFGDPSGPGTSTVHCLSRYAPFSQGEGLIRLKLKTQFFHMISGRGLHFSYERIGF